MSASNNFSREDKPTYPLLDAAASSVAGGKCRIGCNRYKKSHFLINYFLKSNSAGGNLTIRVTCAVTVYRHMLWGGEIWKLQERHWSVEEDSGQGGEPVGCRGEDIVKGGLLDTSTAPLPTGNAST